ncbi:hypothetical protein V5O48_016451, partial [Marasmius crinis-equi]
MSNPTSHVSRSPSLSSFYSTKPKSRDLQVLEPDDEWKQELHVKIETTLMALVVDAEAKKENDLKELPQDRVRIEGEFQSTIMSIRKLAKVQFLEELERYREEKAYTLGLNMGPNWQEKVSKEQEAILKKIQSNQGSATDATSGDMDDSKSKQEGSGVSIPTSMSPLDIQSTSSPHPQRSEPTTSTRSPSSDRIVEKHMKTATPPLSQSPLSNRSKPASSATEPLSAREGPDGEASAGLNRRPSLPSTPASRTQPYRHTPDRQPERPTGSTPHPSSSFTSKPEIWIPPAAESSPQPPQRRGSTASIRSIGSTHRSAMVDVIPESTTQGDTARYMEEEKRKINAAEQQWKGHNAGREKERVRGEDKGREKEKEVEREKEKERTEHIQKASVARKISVGEINQLAAEENTKMSQEMNAKESEVRDRTSREEEKKQNDGELKQQETEPVSPDSLSSSPAQARRPPTPPMNTKPIHRQPSFARVPDGRYYAPQPGPSLLSSSRPSEPSPIASSPE